MQTTEATPSALQRSIDLSVSQAAVQQRMGERLQRLARTVKMPGFRPGKVPMKMVEQTYGSQVYGEVVGDVLEENFAQAVREQNLRVAGNPEIQAKETSAEGQIDFSATFEVYPEVDLSNLSSITFERPMFAVSDVEVDKTLDVLRKQRVSYTAVERASAADDQVVIDFTGRENGEIFQGGQASDFPVVVGGGQMLADFDAQLLGVSAGQSKTFDLTFPADYSPAMAGKTVQFEITVKSVAAPVLPALDTDFALALGVADGDVEKLRSEVRGNVEREVTRRIRNLLRNNVFDALDKAIELPVPKALVQNQAAGMAENAKQDMAQRGMDVKNLPIQAEWFMEQAQKRVKVSLIVADIVKANDLVAKPEQVRSKVESLAQSYEQPAELVKWYYANPERLNDVSDIVVEENVVDWLCGKCQASDKALTFDELMANQQAA